MPVSQKPRPAGKATLRQWAEAPRWAGFGAAIRQVCWQLKLDLREDKHFLTTTVYRKLGRKPVFYQGGG